MLKRIALTCFVAGVLAATGLSQSTTEKFESKLVLESSDARLVEGFNWAKQQALAYAFDGDPVGPWYEASLPGREAFCMRDVAHQSMGGHALGLARYNLNMLRRFAENISESRDWCSFWEIDRYNRPAPVDYRNDAEFWYNLPANFDILDCCYRMYVWTGDTTYIKDPVFQNFYDRTVSDYVERWDLGLDRVMKRKRWMNIRGDFDPANKFHFFRNDPSYDESREDFVLGVDLLATQYAAYLAYAHIQEVRGNKETVRTYLKKAQDTKALVNNAWWDEKTQHFYSILDKDHRFQRQVGAERDHGPILLYRDAADDGPKAQSALSSLLDYIKKEPSSGVEGQSHHAEILYRYGVPDVAYAQMMDLTRPNRDRQEYPEVSYSVIGAIVSGTMGITVVPFPPEASEEGGYVDRIVKTLSGLGNIAWAELRNLPIRANEVAVRHEGGRKTMFTNQRGPSLIWQATFAGAFDTLLVNGEPMKAQAGKELLGRVTSSVTVPVGAGDTVRVEVPK